MTRGLMQVLWPAFLMAAAGCGVFFSLFDPQQLEVFGVVIPPDRMTAYTTGFLAFWALAAGSSWMTYLLTRSASSSDAAPGTPPAPPGATVHTLQHPRSQ